MPFCMSADMIRILPRTLHNRSHTVLGFSNDDTPRATLEASFINSNSSFGSAAADASKTEAAREDVVDVGSIVSSGIIVARSSKFIIVNEVEYSFRNRFVVVHPEPEMKGRLPNARPSPPLQFDDMTAKEANAAA